MVTLHCVWDKVCSNGTKWLVSLLSDVFGVSSIYPRPFTTSAPTDKITLPISTDIITHHGIRVRFFFAMKDLVENLEKNYMKI